MSTKEDTRHWRGLSTRELSYGSQRRIAAFLDAPNSLNWKDLLAMMPEYGPVHMQQLSNQEMRGKSPTISLLNHMSSTGRTVGELYDFSQQLGMKRINELIVEGLRERNIKVDIPPPFSSPPPPSDSQSFSQVKSLHQQQSEQLCRVVVEVPLQAVTNGSSSTDQSTEEQKPAIISSSLLPTAPPLFPLDSQPTALLLSYDTVKEATGCFDEVPFVDGGHKLGQGGFGTVFYGKLGDMKEVAVKVFSDETGSEMSLQFKTELHTISRLKHPNLLPLLGYSCNMNTLCLVYPYMPLGSLDKHLKRLELGCQQRLKIIQDIASGLHYLHTGSDEILVHRDVKSANILLDQQWRGLLTDFGVARTLSLESTTAITQRIVGTRVYMAPEYCTGLVSPAADVYSLGVVILELLFGCLALYCPKGTDTDLLSYLDDYEEDTANLYLSCWSRQDGKRLEDLSDKCTNPVRHNRPTMEKVLREL